MKKKKLTVIPIYTRSITSGFWKDEFIKALPKINKNAKKRRLQWLLDLASNDKYPALQKEFKKTSTQIRCRKTTEDDYKNNQYITKALNKIKKPPFDKLKDLTRVTITIEIIEGFYDDAGAYSHEEFDQARTYEGGK